MCLLRMRQAAFEMCQMAKMRGCTVIVCGSDATDHAEDYLEHGADYILTGEGEQTLVELLHHLTGRSTTNLRQIEGLAWRDEEEGFVQTPPRPVLKELDTLPFPAWDLVDVTRYRRFWQERHGYFSMNMVTTRGCPYHCNWCAKPIWGQRYNVRSPQNVVEELAWLRETYHPDHIWFADDIMGLKPGWIQEFADLVEKNRLRTPFKSLNRVDLLLIDDTIEALKRAGCDICWVGAESGSQKILDAMEKGTTVEQIYQATDRLHKVGIRVGFFLQFGYPGETWDDIEKTIQMVRDCRPDDIGISVSYPLPGTKFYERVKRELGGKQNWLDSNDLAMLYRGPYSTEFYRNLHAVIHKEFRLRKGWQELAPLRRRSAKFQTRHLRTLTRMVRDSATLPIARLVLAQRRSRPQAPTVSVASAAGT
jgi:anaerobic magnesium-protoporphyrin IX monomethyl ester cyclase